MNVLTKCELCETPTRIGVDGRELDFAAHSAEYCAAQTKFRIRILEQMANRAVLDSTAWGQELARHADESRRLAEGIFGILDQIRKGRYPNEYAVADELEKILWWKPQPAQRAPDGRVSAAVATEALRELSSVDMAPPGWVTPPHAEDVDLHHSQGVTVAAVIAGTPLGRACEACKAAIGRACVDVGYPPTTGPDGFHEVRRHPATPESVPQR